jgi:predicted metalloprotease
MRLDDMRESDNVDDRRGESYGGGGGFGPRMVMGSGGLGLVAVVVISLLFGVDPSQLLGGGAAAGNRMYRCGLCLCPQGHRLGRGCVDAAAGAEGRALHARDLDGL